MDFAIARRRMVEQQVLARGITDRRVIDAMLAVPRHRFVEDALQSQAYSDFPLPIGYKQTISQPYMVAFMSQALNLEGGERVLEIGTGSGYQAAILARLAGRVYSIERHAELARRARRALDAAGFSSVNLKVDDGTVGWPEQAPFDAIITTAGAPAVPVEYREQLAVGGRLVIPVGDRVSQVLVRVVRRGEGTFEEERLIDCRFVPLVGRCGWTEEEA